MTQLKDETGTPIAAWYLAWTVFVVLQEAGADHRRGLRPVGQVAGAQVDRLQRTLQTPVKVLRVSGEVLKGLRRHSGLSQGHKEDAAS